MFESFTWEFSPNMCPRRSKNERFYLQNEPLDLRKETFDHGIDFGAFFCVFWLFWGGFWTPFWAPFGILFASIFQRRFWRGFGSVLASVWEAFWNHFEYFFAPSGHSEEKTWFSRKPMNYCLKFMILRVGGGQFWCFFGVFFDIVSGPLFLSILVDFGFLLGSKNRPKQAPKMR